jgi:peptide/nickel transport system substrate-binding protein
MLVTLAVSAATIFAVGFVSRSAAAPVDGKATVAVMRVAIPIFVNSVNPATNGVAAYLTSLEGLEYLMRLGPNGVVKPHLAERVTQPGRGVYVYHLRKGVKFWIGNEMTSADVVNALNYQRHPTSEATSFAFPSVKTITAKDRYTVVVTLKYPDAGWKYVPTGSMCPPTSVRSSRRSSRTSTRRTWASLAR